MSKIRLYIDEDAVERGLVKACRNNCIDVITTLDVSRVTFSDQEQLIWATEQGRVIYTFNRKDFSRLHNEFLAEKVGHAALFCRSTIARTVTISGD